MGYDHDRERSGETTAATLSLALLLIILLGAAAGAVMYTWTVSRRAVAEQQVAVLATERAELAVQAASAEANRQSQLASGEAKPNSPDDPAAGLILAVDQQGRVLNDDQEPLTDEALSRLLAERPVSRVELEIDKRCPYGRVIEIEQACRSAVEGDLQLVMRTRTDAPAAGLILAVNQQGRVLNDDQEPLTDEALSRLLAERPVSRVELEIDKRCPFGRVIEIEQACRSAVEGDLQLVMRTRSASQITPP